MNLPESHNAPITALATAGGPDRTTPLINRLAHCNIPVTVVLGQTRMRISDVLKITAGSLVELDKREGEMAEIVVRGAVVARGEVVSIGGNYALRIVEVMSREGRRALQQEAVARTRRHSMPSAGQRKI